jgi:AraC-like DNA-binding protein
MSGTLGAGTVIRITEGLALILGEISDTKPHSHHAVQVSIALEGEFLLEHGSGERAARLAIIDSDHRHRLSGPGIRQATLLMEPESSLGHAVKDWLAGRAFFAAGRGAEETAEILRRSAQAGRPLAGAALEALSALGVPPCAHGPADPRVLESLEILKSARGKKTKIAMLAAKVGLSESRLQHLFKEGIGISIKSFLLWKRLLDAVQRMSERKDFTFSALEAGFFDSAHLSRTFKAMFGMRPLDVFKESRSVQVIRE